MKISSTLIGAILVGMVAGCANPGIVQISRDTYLLSRADHAGVFGNAGALKASVIKDANEFAASKGKVAVPVSAKQTPVYPGHFATFEYQFQLLDPNDPRASGASLVPRPDLVITKTEHVSADIRTSDTSEKKPDLYTEIMKLDDLRKKGLLTDAEFEAQKQDLLQRRK